MDNSTELSSADLFAGLSLLLFGMTGLIFCLFSTYILGRLAKHMSGFRFLFSETLATNLFAWQFGIWPGIVILLQRDPLPVSFRPAVNAWTDFTAFVVYEHQVLVAFTRFVAVRFPVWYVGRMGSFVWPLCVSAYVIGMVQAIYLQMQEWYIVVYYDPFAYGFNSEDWSGQAPFWQVYNLLMVGSPFLFYGVAFYSYVKIMQVTTTTDQQGGTMQAWASNTTTWNEAKQRLAEAKLMAPCFIHACAHAATYFTYYYSSQYVGIWAGWLILMLFLCKTFIGPLLVTLLTDVVKDEIKIVMRKN